MDVVNALSEPESSENEEYETMTIASETAPDPLKYDEEMDLAEERVALDKKQSKLFPA